MSGGTEWAGRQKQQQSILHASSTGQAVSRAPTLYYSATLYNKKYSSKKRGGDQNVVQIFKKKCRTLTNFIVLTYTKNNWKLNNASDIVEKSKEKQLRHIFPKQF